MAAASVPPPLPDQFGRYRIVRRLGQGAMGAVYLAHDTQLDRSVALKVPHIVAEDGPGALQRFQREARAAAALDHPNLCRVYDVGMQNDVPYLTMAYVEGRTLAEVIKGGKLLPQTEAAGIVHKLALAMHEAHANGIIHRDLKPANVMINPRGEPVVMDFGLARLSNRSNTRLTQLGAVIGTPSYMPPEQVRGDVDAMGPGCDVYSLGALLYHLLTGHVPFEGPVDAVLGQILTQPPPPPSSFRPDLDPRLEAVCLRAMQKEIAARYASMSELAAALADCVRAPDPPHAAAVILRQTMPALLRSVPAHAVAAARTVCEVAGAERRDAATSLRAHPGSGRSSMGIAGVLIGGLAFLVFAVGAVGAVALLVWATSGPKLDSAVAVAPKTPEQLVNPIAPPKTAEKPDKPVAPPKTDGKPDKPVGLPKTDEKPDKPPKVEEKPDKTVALPKEQEKPDKPVAPPVPAAPLQKLAKIEQVDLGGGVKLKLVRIDPEWFMMGSPENERGHALEELLHKIEITKPCYMGVYAVTQRQYRSVMGTDPSSFSVKTGKPNPFGLREFSPSNPGMARFTGKAAGLKMDEFPVATVSWQEDFAAFQKKGLDPLDPTKRVYRERVAGLDTEDFPVETVSWADAIAFCKAVSALPAMKERSWTADLPTEAEWEYSCRAGTTTAFHYGDSLSSAQANFNGDYAYAGETKWKNLSRPQPVGSYRRNAWGLYDMHGNIFQMCKDFYLATYYKDGPAKDPLFTEPLNPASRRICRGGSWHSNPYECRAAYRSAAAKPTLLDRKDRVNFNPSSEEIGFRIVVRLAATPCELLATTEREAEEIRPKTEAEDKEECAALAKKVLADLQNPNAKTRREAMWPAGELGQRDHVSAKEMVPALIARLANSDDREPAIRALIFIGKLAVPDLIKGLDDKHVFVRLGSVRVLGDIGPNAQNAIPVLERLLTDSSATVRESAKAALKQIRQ